MEKPGTKTLLAILKIMLVAVCIALGLFFTLETYLCLSVDGVHVLGFTVMPALALIFFTLAWLLLRHKKRPSPETPDDEREDDLQGDAK